MRRIPIPNGAWSFRLPSLVMLVALIAVLSDSVVPAPAFAQGVESGYCMDHPEFSADPQNPQQGYDLLVVNQNLEPPEVDAPIERLDHGGFIAYVVLTCRPPVLKFELLTKDGDPVYYRMLDPNETRVPIGVTVAGDDTNYFADSHGHSSVQHSEIDAEIFGLQNSPYISNGAPQAFSHRWVLSPESAAAVGGTISHLDPYGSYNVRVTFYTGTPDNPDLPLGYTELSVGPHMDNSIWARILNSLNPFLWAFRINMAVSYGVTTVLCIPLEFVGVHSSNCLGEDIDTHARQNDKFPSAINVEIAGLRKVAPPDPERERRAMLVRLRERGYPIQVASHNGGTPLNNHVTDVAAEGQPFIGRSTCWLPGDTVEFLVSFDKPTAVVRPLALSLDNFRRRAGGTHNHVYQFAYYAGTVSSPGGTWHGDLGAPSTAPARDYDMRTTHKFVYEVPEASVAEVSTEVLSPPGRERGIHLIPLLLAGEASSDLAYQAGGTFFVLMDEPGETNLSYTNQDDLIDQSRAQANTLNELSSKGLQTASGTIPDQTDIRDNSLLYTNAAAAFIGVAEPLDALVSDADVREHLTGVKLPRRNDVEDLTWANHCVHYETKTLPGIAPKMTFTGVIEGTPAHLTYGLPIVRQGWRVMLSLVVAVLLILIAFTGMQMIVSQFTGHSSGGVRELVPRFILAIIAAATSLWWSALLVDLADGVTKFVSAALDVRAGDVVFISKNALNGLFTNIGGVFGGSGGVGGALGTVGRQALAVGITSVFNILLIIFALLGLMIIAQFIIRLVMINLLTVLAPLGAAMWAIPQTTSWGKKWLQFWMTTLFQQALQIVGLALALGYIRGVVPPSAGANWDDFIWALGMGIAALFITYKLPTMIGAPGIYESWMQTLTMLTMTAANIGSLAGRGMGGAVGGAMGSLGRTRMGTGIGVGAINVGQRLGQTGLGQSPLLRGVGRGVGAGLRGLTSWQYNRQ